MRRLQALQLAAVARVAWRSTVNSIARRQGRGTALALPLLVAFLAVQLGRFGARGAQGMRAVLERCPQDRGVHYAAWWWLLLAAALVAFKYVRAVPGRGSRRVFDLVLVRALPVTSGTRAAYELLDHHLAATGVLALVYLPLLWGTLRHQHGVWVSLAGTVGAGLAVNSLCAGVSYALDLGVARRLEGRALDLTRVLSGLVTGAVMGMLIAWGPIAAGGARSLTVDPRVPGWSRWLPTRPWAALSLARSAEELPSVVALALPALGVLALSAAVALAWLRAPTDLSLDGAQGPSRGGRWEPSLALWRAELRAQWRQAPYLFLAPPAFLGFFAVLARSARRNTGADMSPLVLFSLEGWAVLVLSIALAGSVARRWRRTLWLLPSAGGDARVAIRALSRLHALFLVPLALTPLWVLWQARQPPWWFYPRTILGHTLTLALGPWLLTGSVFLQLDPSPERLTGLSLGATLGVMLAAMPCAALVVLLPALPLATWLALLGMLGLFGWAVETAAAERLRHARDDDGDPLHAQRAWPALRAFAMALGVQTLVTAALDLLPELSDAAKLLPGYAAFAAVLLPWSLRARRAYAPATTWGAAPALALGVLAGVANFALASGYARVVSGLQGPARGPMTEALAHASGAGRVALVLLAALLGPLTEEAFFRGWLQPAFGLDLGARRRWAALPLTAVVFSMLHAGEAWAPALVAGLLAGALRARSGRLGPSAAMHVTNNSLAMAFALSG
ncbi:MAG: CPBP family intramembrane metalloprotease [Deltaproteobacteria bacterium]|nr:CPBP family intramembrane metalloprotease [Deltaproteobacteria bacterium]